MSEGEHIEISIIDSRSDSAIADVLSLQSELAVGHDLIKQGIKKAESGMLISGYTRKEIENFVFKGGRVFVANDGGSHKAIGYLLATTPEDFTAKYLTATVNWRSEKYEEKYGKIIADNKYIYLDQIGVAFDMHKTGISYRLLESFEDIYRGETAVVLVISKPIDNVRSKTFFERNNYIEIAKIFFKKYGTLENVEGCLLIKQL